MDNFWDKRRRVYGKAQIAPNEEIIGTAEYARRSGYSVSLVARRCRQKKLRAYKLSGKWKILVINN